MRLLTTFAAESRSQLIYSTHSPFMLDWSFPQRIRLFERDYTTGRGTIINKPYHPGTKFSTVWAPLWSTIGVTLGDLSQLGERNVFVEGVSDQVILANASADANARGLPHLDLAHTSIVPYSDHQVLGRLLDTTRERNAPSVAVIDTDRPNAQSNMAQFKQANVPTVPLDQFSDTPSVHAAIEDVIGVDDYLRFLNECYSPFDWFTPISADDVRANRGTRTLSRYVSDVLAASDRSLDKVRVASWIASNFQTLRPETKDRLDQLVSELSATLARLTVP